MDSKEVMASEDQVEERGINQAVESVAKLAPSVAR